MRRILVFVTAALGVCATALARPLPPQGAPLPVLRPHLVIYKIGHRGAMRHAPENTVASFEAALQMGADFLEMDVRFTKDGHAVLMHDPAVDRTTDGHGLVKDMTLAQFKQLTIKPTNPKFRGLHPPTFEEALKAIQGRGCLYWDAKEPPTLQAVALVKSLGFDRDCVVIVAGGERADEFVKLWPDAPVMPGITTVADVAANLKRHPTVRAFNSDAAQVDPKAIEAAHALGIPVFTNTLMMQDMPSFHRRVIEKLGSMGIQTDQLDAVNRLLDKLKSQPPAAPPPP